MKWINFLHLYQPINTDAHIIKEATEESYYRIVRALEENPNIAFNLNINACLIMRWEHQGYLDIINRIDKLIKKGQIELTGTACYHPLLPLIPQAEVKRQIIENESVLKQFFGSDFKPRGFYLPELAYSVETAKIIKEMGYEWLILDDFAINHDKKEVDYNKVYLDNGSQLKIVLRSRKLSNSYVPKTITDIYKNKKQDFAITASDGELYGLRHKDPTGVFEKLLKHKGLKTINISDFIDSNKDTESIDIPAHSWETNEEEFKHNEPFNLWQAKDNPIHNKLWQLANLAYEITEKHKDDPNYYWARWHFVRGLASCTFWWASGRNFFYQFGPVSWNPDEIERGINELIRSIRALEKEETRAEKLKAEKLYIALKQLIWERHWEHHWKK